MTSLPAGNKGPTSESDMAIAGVVPPYGSGAPTAPHALHNFEFPNKTRIELPPTPDNFERLLKRTSLIDPFTVWSSSFNNPSDAHRVRRVGCHCLSETLASRRAAGTGREDPQPHTNPFQLWFAMTCGRLCVEQRRESRKKEMRGIWGVNPKPTWGGVVCVGASAR